MSENYRFYVAKMNERRARRRSAAEPLQLQLAELFSTIARCEAMWALEERIEKRR